MIHKQYRIGDICKLIKGISPTLKTEPGSYPLVVTAEYRRTANMYQLEGPAVCIPLISSTGHGDAALHRVHYQEGKFALANLLVALLPKEASICDAKYLYHLLMTKKNAYFVPLMAGTANVSLKEKDIAEVEIPLPSLSEQQRIVARIENLITKIEETRLIRMENETTQRHLLLAAYHQISKDASRKPMGKVAPLVRRPEIVSLEAEYPQIAVRSFGKGTFHKPLLLGSEITWQKPYLVKAGDILISNIKAWEGAIAVAEIEDEGRFGSHRYLTCVPTCGTATARFVCFHLLTPEGLHDIGEASPGSADRNRTLNTKALLDIPIPVPSYEEQLWFDELYGKVEQKKKLEDDSTVELDALLPSILDKAFKGEL